MKPQLKKGLVVTDVGDSIQIGTTFPIAQRIRGDLKKLKAILPLLDGEHKIFGIAKKTGRSAEEIHQVISNLSTAGFLEEKEKTGLKPKENARYQQQFNFWSLLNLPPQKTQSMLKNTRILLIGVGGGGSQMLLSCAVLGVGNITIVDFDNVSLSNLNRQIIYTENDVGVLKIEAAKKKIQEINPNISLSSYNDRIDSLAKADKYITKNFDLVICTADGPVYKLYEWVNKICVQKNIPWVSMGVMELSAFIGPFVIPHKTACYNCHIREKLKSYPNYLELVENLEQSKKLHQFESASLYPLFAIACNTLMLDVLNYLFKFENKLQTTNNIIEISFLTGQTTRPIEKTSGCSICRPRLKRSTPQQPFYKPLA